MPGEVLSLKIVPNKIPKKMFVIRIGSSLIINNKMLSTDMNCAFEINEIIKPESMQTKVCNKPIERPTRKYPSMKWWDFIGEENNLFKKDVSLSLETIKESVNITKEYENTIMPGINDGISKVGVLPFENLLITKNNKNIIIGKPKQKI